MAKDFEDCGGIVLLEHEVTGFSPEEQSTGFSSGVVIQSKNQEPVSCRRVITCGGLYSDK